MESIYENGGFIGPTLAFDDPDFYQVETTIPRGEAEFTTAGTFSWTAPEGVTSVSVVAVGAGGGPAANTSGASGAGGGGLGWKNNIAVTPGVSYTVVVGAGGTRVTSGTAPAGGTSHFINTSTVRGGGGGGGVSAGNTGGAGGTFTGDGGGNGGVGGGRNASTAQAGGGGGAGGYSGNGGRGGQGTSTTVVSTNGAGGGGGGGGGAGSADSGGSGGGVGIYGEGANGSRGATTTADGRGGFGGSGGGNATFASTSTTAQNVYSTENPSTPGLYGGGGCGADTTNNEQAPGAGGAVRIIWGGNRAFPSTNTADGQGETTALVTGNQKNSGIWNLKAVYNALSGGIVRTNLALYLDAADSESYSGSGATWSDISGNDRDFLWYGGGSNYEVDSGVPCFATLGDRCRGPASNSFGIDNTSGYTIFLVVKQITLTSAAAFQFYKDGTGEASRGIFSHLAFTNNIVYFDQGGCCTTDYRTQVASGGTTTWNVWTLRRETAGSTRSIFKNGTILTTNTDTAANINLNSTAVDLGSAIDYGNTSSAWNAKLNSFIVYNRGLTDAEVAANASYIAGRLGI